MPKDKPTSERYKEIVAGVREPQGCEKGWLNLQKGQREHNLAVIDPERRKEICRMGAEAIHQLHGEKKTARQSLERILTLKVSDEILAGADVSEELAKRIKRDNPDMTLYDLIQLVAAGRAVSGNIKAAEYIRDTHGDKPVEHVQVDADITTQQDRELLANIAQRLESSEIVVVKDQTE